MTCPRAERGRASCPATSPETRPSRPSLIGNEPWTSAHSVGKLYGFCPTLPKYCNAAILLFIMEARSTFVSVQRRGVISLPADLRERYHLNDAGAQVELAERDDGVIELRPNVAVPAEQRWFWSERWQNMEREVERHVERGEVTRHDDADAFLEHLDELPE
jgi:bifunctional DNA-binding transcriptional regulator/antitoxin component of YhaV-PrlF toxin-antitoxin module